MTVELPKDVGLRVDAGALIEAEKSAGRGLTKVEVGAIATIALLCVALLVGRMVRMDRAAWAIAAGAAVIVASGLVAYFGISKGVKEYTQERFNEFIEKAKQCFARGGEATRHNLATELVIAGSSQSAQQLTSDPRFALYAQFEEKYAEICRQQEEIEKQIQERDNVAAASLLAKFNETISSLDTLASQIAVEGEAPKECSVDELIEHSIPVSAQTRVRSLKGEASELERRIAAMPPRAATRPEIEAFASQLNPILDQIEEAITSGDVGQAIELSQKRDTLCQKMPNDRNLRLEVNGVIGSQNERIFRKAHTNLEEAVKKIGSPTYRDDLDQKFVNQAVAAAYLSRSDARRFLPFQVYVSEALRPLNLVVEWRE